MRETQLGKRKREIREKAKAFFDKYKKVKKVIKWSDGYSEQKVDQPLNNVQLEHSSNRGGNRKPPPQRAQSVARPNQDSPQTSLARPSSCT